MGRFEPGHETDDPAQAGQLAMRDGDAVADPGGPEALALQQCLEDPAGIETGEHGRVRRQFLESLLLAGDPYGRQNGFRIKEVEQRHRSSNMGCEAEPASRLYPSKSRAKGTDTGHVRRNLVQRPREETGSSLLASRAIALSSRPAQRRIDPTDGAIAPAVYDVHAARASMDEHEDGRPRHVEFLDGVAHREGVQGLGGLGE